MQWFIDIIMEMVAALGYTTLAEVLATIRGTRFLAYRHNSTQSVPSGGLVRVAYNDVYFDTKSEWFAAGERLDIAEDGYYQVSFSVGFRPTVAANKKFILQLMNNGSLVAISMNHSSHNDFLSACGSILAHFNAGDKITCLVYHNCGFNVNLDYSQNLTYLSVERVP